METQKERDVLQRRLYYMNKAKNDIRGDLSTMRRATEKVDSEVTKLEADKKIQVCLKKYSKKFKISFLFKLRIYLLMILYDKLICFVNKFQCMNINYEFKVNLKFKIFL